MTVLHEPGVRPAPERAKPEILFVDDEPHVLSGLRRLLWRQKDRWSLSYVTSGAEALAHLAAHDVDVLVTDMRMPGMDGAALLDHVRRDHPGVARLVLSGHADHAAIIDTSGLTQQFLSKPCDQDLLIRVLESSVGAQQLVQSERLRSLIGGQKALPKPPEVYTQLLELTRDPATTMTDVARLIETDVAVTAEMLKLVNSSFFGLSSRITTSERAVTTLGLDVVKQLVLAGHVFRSSHDLPADLDAAALAERGLLGSRTIKRLGREEGWDPETTNRLSLAALLHDVGLLVLAADDHDAWQAYRSSAPSTPQRQRELDSFGCTIGLASAHLLGLWGFHEETVAALAEQPVDLFEPCSRYAASPAGLAVAFGHGGQTMFADLLVPEPGKAPREVYLTPKRVTSWLGLLA